MDLCVNGLTCAWYNGCVQAKGNEMGVRRLTIGVGLALLVAGASTASGKEDRCKSVPKDMVAGIEEGFEKGVQGKWRLHNAQAVRSKAFKKLYFISAEIDGPGVAEKGDIGTWASNSLQLGGGLIMSVSPMAREFSVWPYGSKTRAEISMFDDGASASQRCVRRLNEGG